MLRLESGNISGSEHGVLEQQGLAVVFVPRVILREGDAGGCVQRGGVVVAYRVVGGGDIVGCQRRLDMDGGGCQYAVIIRGIDRTFPTRIIVVAGICPLDGQAVPGRCQDDGAG